MSQIITAYYKSPVGELLLGDFEGKLCLADWRYRNMRTSIDDRIQKGLSASYVEGATEVIECAKNQLKAYFEGKTQAFDIPLLFVGSDFQKQVWKALMEIPFGVTKSYMDLSKQLGNEKAIRAVASAHGANAISIIVPCHRIIGSNGELTGYAGGLPAKKKLLQLEGSYRKQEMQFG